MKKRNQRLQEFQTMGRKVLCARFAETLKNNIAAGDQDNNLLLFNTATVKPITVLNAQASNVSSLTALTFTRSDDQIIVGSNRGSMNIWDLSTLKIAYCLKGHTIEICSLFADRKNQNIIVSGSLDTNVKLWDLRNKACIFTLKNHKMKISALTISPDSRMLASGGEDGVVQILDIRMNKQINQFQIETPVLCLDISASAKIAVGCMDRSAKIYQINSPFECQGITKSDTMPVASCNWHKNDFLITGGTDNLKVWDTRNQLLMTDNIETSSKGILDMIVDDKIQQIAFTGGSLSYHQCFLSDVNFEGPYVYSNPSISYEKEKGVDEAISKNNHIKRANSINKSIVSQITNDKVKNIITKRSQSIAKQLSGVTQNVNEALTNIQKATDDFNTRKNEAIQLKDMMSDDHSKFLKIMAARLKSIETILELWMKGNIKTLIQMLKGVDMYVAADVLAQILKPSKVQISAEFGLIISEKAKEMIQSKHLTIIKNGLEYMLQVVTLFKDDMIKLKTFGCDQGVDLAREERLRRFDLIIEQYVEVYQSHRLKRLSDNHDQTSKLAQQLSGELTKIFKKVFGKEYEI